MLYLYTNFTCYLHPVITSVSHLQGKQEPSQFGGKVLGRTKGIKSCTAPATLYGIIGLPPPLRRAA